MSRRLALIIGSGEYEDTKLAGLRTPDADVGNLAEVLRDPEIGGFDEVTALLNQPSAVVRRGIARLFAEKSPDDLLLLFFSGHGIRDDNGDLYLAVKDTENNLLSATAIPAGYITAEMDRSRSRRQVLILDCCHSGAFARGTKGAAGISVGTAAAFEGNGYGRVVLTASDSTQYAWEGDQIIGQPESSVFTSYLVQGLKTGEADADADGRITLDELFDFVYGKVVSKTPKQTPGKWAYKQQGEIIIAHNPRPVVKPADLPPELIQAMEHSIPAVREGAARELERLLRGGHKGLARAAHTALVRLKDDDSRRVSAAAAAILASYVEPRAVAGEQTGASRPNVEPPAARTPDQEEPVVSDKPPVLKKLAPASQPIAEKQEAHVPRMPERAKPEQETGKRKLPRAVRTTAWWLFGLNIWFAIWGVGLVGVIGAIGMLKGRNWGRKCGLISALLFELVGVVYAIVIVFALAAEPASSSDTEAYLGFAFLTLIVMSIGIILACRLNSEAVVCGLGGKPGRPAGILPIAIPMMPTIIGMLPALGLLRRRAWGRSAAMVFLSLFIFVSLIGSVALGTMMKSGHYDYTGSYYSSKNELGFAVALIEAIGLSIWCARALYYLKSESVKNWFRNISL